jgi:hypothetical protein
MCVDERERESVCVDWMRERERSRERESNCNKAKRGIHPRVQNAQRLLGKGMSRVIHIYIF